MQNCMTGPSKTFYLPQHHCVGYTKKDKILNKKPIFLDHKTRHLIFLYRVYHESQYTSILWVHYKLYFGLKTLS